MKSKLSCIYIIVFLLISCNSATVLAQRSMSKKGMQVTKRINLAYIDSDEGFQVTEVPEKWKEESAVIICQISSFVYSRESTRKIGVQELSRKRIKLQDKAAVEKFSEFFYINVPNSSVGFSIIKPDGKEIVADPSEAIEVTEDIPAMYRAYSRTLSYRKLAIPSLEVGDIIDYAYVYENIRRPGMAEVFDPVIMTLPRNYPVVKQIVEFDVDRGFFLNFNSFNGAPDLEEVPLTDAQKASKRYDNVKKYSFVDEMQEKEKDEEWHFPFRSLPSIKFQVYYLESAAQKYNWIFYLGEQGEPHKEVSTKDINRKTSKHYQYTEPVYFTLIHKYLKKYHRNEKDRRKLVELTYYYFRHLVTTYGIPYGGKEVNDLVFAKTMERVLDKHHIETEVNVCVPRTLGTLEEVLFPAEISAFVIVKIKERDYMVLHNFDKFSNLGDTPYYLEGVVGAKSSEALENGYGLPVTTYEQNKTHSHTTIDFNETMDELKVNRSLALKGHNRVYEWSYLVLDSEYLPAELQRHPLVFTSPSMKRPKLAEMHEEEAESRLEYLEANANRELKVELASYDSFELQNDGRYHDNPVLKYNESFTLTDLLQKAGGNYIVEIGRFIGSQVEITEEIEERQYDIYMLFARSFLNEIELMIPEGYTVEGIEALNMEVDNDTGSFKSAAKIEGNKLLIETQKVYKNNYEPKGNWSKMIDFLEAAYQFSQQKVVLKKQ